MYTYLHVVEWYKITSGQYPPIHPLFLLPTLTMAASACSYCTTKMTAWRSFQSQLVPELCATSQVWRDCIWWQDYIVTDLLALENCNCKLPFLPSQRCREEVSFFRRFLQHFVFNCKSLTACPHFLPQYSSLLLCCLNLIQRVVEKRLDDAHTNSKISMKLQGNIISRAIIPNNNIGI